MQIISSTHSLNRYMSRRRYRRLDGGTYNRKKMKAIRIGGSSRPQSFWKIKAAVRLRPTVRLIRTFSLLRFWRKFKNAYVNMMLSLGGQYSGGDYVLSGKRVPKARKTATKYTNDEFHNRLVYEIYKNLMPSLELTTTR